MKIPLIQCINKTSRELAREREFEEKARQLRQSLHNEPAVIRHDSRPLSYPFANLKLSTQ